MNLGDIIRLNAQLYPMKDAIVCGDRRISFLEFNLRVNRLINGLYHQGLRKGGRMGIIAGNCPEYMEVYGAAEKGGFVVVPVNPRLAIKDITYILNNAEVDVLFVEGSYVDSLNDVKNALHKIPSFITIRATMMDTIDYEHLLADSKDDEPNEVIEDRNEVYLLYTGGTTGKPKGVLMTQGGHLQNTKCMLIETGVTNEDKLLTVMPLYHIGGKCFTTVHFHRACTNVILPSFDPKNLLETIERERIKCALLAPTMIKLLLDYLADNKGYNLSSIRNIYYSSAPMPVSLLREAIKVFGNVFVQFYGLSESGPSATILYKQDHAADGTEEEQKRLASAGRPMIYNEVQVVKSDGTVASPGEVGEIRIKNEMVMKGYWNNAEATAEVLKDGWVYSGDFGRVDDDGFVYVVGRKKDVIKSGGEAIYPREIEEVINSLPGVQEVAVVGVPDEKWGEAVKAVIVCKPAFSLTEEEVINHCKENLASFKKPRSVEFRSNLPKSPLGKILKNEIRDEYWAGLERQI